MTPRLALRAIGSAALLSGALLGAPGCDQGGGGSAANVLPITVSPTTSAAGYVNALFTSVTVCVPGTTNCQTIDSVLVDTGSVGLRLLSASAGGAFSLGLPLVKSSAGDAVAECNEFLDGFTWGPLELADVQMADEKALAVPIQVIGDPDFSSVPASCSATGGASEDTLQDLSARGILGVGPFTQDCGPACAASPAGKNSANPGNVYYACPSSGCVSAAVALSDQVQNPVSALPVDNDGVIVELPSVASGGVSTVTGSLVFGIGTKTNNGLQGATVLPIDPDEATFTTLYGGQLYPSSFIDSGSNALYVLDARLTGLPVCSDSPFYCPKETTSLTATNEGTNGASAAAAFSVANTDMLSGADFAFDDLAAPSTGGEYFDWGLPFFFGRNVFTAIQGAGAPGGKTPYFAY